MEGINGRREYFLEERDFEQAWGLLNRALAAQAPHAAAQRAGGNQRWHDADVPPSQQPRELL